MSAESQTVIEGWAIVERFGHNKMAGYVTTAMIGTSGMLRVDVPEVGTTPGFTRFYGPGAVYSLTLVTEDVARAALKSLRPEPVTVYIPRQLASAAVEMDDREYEAYDDEDREDAS